MGKTFCLLVPFEYCSCGRMPPSNHLSPNRNIINEEDETIKNKTIEGTRLVRLTPSDEGSTLKKFFTNYVMLYAKCYNFTPSMAPFSNRTNGHEWFTRDFPKPSTDLDNKTMAI